MRVWSEKEEKFQYQTGPQRLDTIHLVVEVYMSGIPSHFIQSKKTLVLPALISLEDSPHCRIVCLHCASLYIEFSILKTELRTGKSFTETASNLLYSPPNCVIVLVLTLASSNKLTVFQIPFQSNNPAGYIWLVNLSTQLFESTFHRILEV